MADSSLGFRYRGRMYGDSNNPTIQDLTFNRIVLTTLRFAFPYRLYHTREFDRNPITNDQ